MKTRYIFIIFLFLLVSATFYSCNDNSTNPAIDNFELSYTSSRDTVLTDASNILILDTVKILLKDIKLNVASTGDSSNFKVGPYVLFLNLTSSNLTSSVNSIGTGFIPAGSYDKIQFEVHKLETNETPPDPDFRDSLGNYSVVVKGRFNGTPFVYKSTKSAKQKINYPTIVTLYTETKTNVTLLIRPQIWFMKDNDYLDPNNTANWSDIDNNIKDNIKGNFKAFKDNNKDGIPD
ncbi:MAG TPA: hypothetical protein VIL99_05660 [Ignavibacteria bacterium]